MKQQQRQQSRRQLRPSLSNSLIVALCWVGSRNHGASGFVSPWGSRNQISTISATRTPTSSSSQLQSQSTDEAGSYDPAAGYVTEADVAAQANDLLASSKNVIDLPDEVSNSFMQYALSIILGRALPDARDGMKPVHRRILYAMNGLGMNPTTSFRKCARVVGEVLGK